MVLRTPMPVIFIATVLLALISGFVVEDSPLDVVVVYTADDVPAATWHEETGGMAAPVGRRMAVVLDAGGRASLLVEQPAIQPLLDQTRVDFDEQVLIVAAMGAQPTGGYSLTIRSLQAIPERGGRHRIVLQLAVSSPNPDDTPSATFTYPADVAVIAKDAWPRDVLASLIQGDTVMEVVDQDGRLWGPAFVYRTPPSDDGDLEDDAVEVPLQQSDDEPGADDESDTDDE